MTSWHEDLVQNQTMAVSVIVTTSGVQMHFSQLSELRVAGPGRRSQDREKPRRMPCGGPMARPVRIV